MTTNPLRIGNGQGFWGDSASAPLTLASQEPYLDYLTLDYLAEASMSIMAIQKEKDPNVGYARDFIQMVKAMIPLWQKGSPLKIVTNAGGLNPIKCAEECRNVLQGELKRPFRIGVVVGDDIFPLCRENPENPLFDNLEMADSMIHVHDRLVTANAYLGADGIADALKQGADIVITGRVADPSLTVGPCIAHFGWALTDYEKLAGATIAGHLIECGTQVTGGISTHWLKIPMGDSIGFPIAEVSADGSCIVTKPEKTGGEVSTQTVKEQLLYEIGDPDRYLSPDVTVSFLSLEVEEIGRNRVRITGAKGKPPPLTYKVSSTYRDGYRVEAMLTIFGQEAPLKARRAAEMLLNRCRAAGYPPQRSSIECLGDGAVVPGVITSKESVKECVLRMGLADRKQETLEFFAKEVYSLVTSGPQGTTGYMTGRPHIREVFAYWPCLVERNLVQPTIQILEVL